MYFKSKSAVKKFILTLLKLPVGYIHKIIKWFGYSKI